MPTQVKERSHVVGEHPRGVLLGGDVSRERLELLVDVVGDGDAQLPYRRLVRQTSEDPVERGSGMENVRITWVQGGEQRESAVTYSPSAAEDYKGYKEAEEGVSDVRIVPAQP